MAATSVTTLSGYAPLIDRQASSFELSLFSAWASRRPARRRRRRMEAEGLPEEIGRGGPPAADRSSGEGQAWGKFIESHLNTLSGREPPTIVSASLFVTRAAGRPRGF